MIRLSQADIILDSTKVGKHSTPYQPSFLSDFLFFFHFEVLSHFRSSFLHLPMWEYLVNWKWIISGWQPSRSRRELAVEIKTPHPSMWEALGIKFSLSSKMKKNALLSLQINFSATRCHLQSQRFSLYVYTVRSCCYATSLHTISRKEEKERTMYWCSQCILHRISYSMNMY